MQQFEEYYIRKGTSNQHILHRQVQSWPKSVTTSCLLSRCHAFWPADVPQKPVVQKICLQTIYLHE